MDEKKLQEIGDWLSPLDFNEKQNTTLSRCTPGTGMWFLKEPRFQAWLRDEYRVLWCPGNSGVGKTFIVSITINHLQESYCLEDTAVVFIYLDYKAEHSAAQLTAALLKQLACQFLTTHSMNFLLEHKKTGSYPKGDELWGIFKSEVEKYLRVFIVVDALDECSEKQGSSF